MVSLRDSHIAAIAARPGGWIGERISLPEAVGAEALRILGLDTPEPSGMHFLSYLQLIFSHTTEIEIVRCRAAEAVGSSREASNTRKRQPTGLPARLVVRLQQQRNTYDELCGHGVGTEEMRQFLKVLAEDRELFWLVNLAVLQTSRRHLTLYWKEENERELFLALPPAFELCKQQLRSAVRRGAADPAFEHMTRGLAALFLEFTGRLPGRSTDAMKDGCEQGAFLALCQLMASALNDALPVQYRRAATPDMVKTVRRMVKELKGAKESCTAS